MKTKNDIYLDIKESDYSFNFKGLSFFFSSKFYLKKFSDLVENYINEETLKLQNKYKMKINMELYFMLVLYNKIEKRGFRVYDIETGKEISRKSSFGVIFI